MPATKPWWQSRTLWINGLLIVAYVLGAVVDAQLYTDPRAVTLLGVAAGAVNMLLRFATSAALTTSASPQPAQPYPLDTLPASPLLGGSGVANPKPPTPPAPGPPTG